jgi:hypothetical protein
VGLHICTISVGGSDERGEWVCLVADGPLPSAISGLLLSDFTQTQQHAHVYEFRSYDDGTPIVLQPGERVFVFTTKVREEWVNTKDGYRALILSMGLDAPIWNNNGDVAYLRNADGTFIDTMTVGDPDRHPGGH